LKTRLFQSGWIAAILFFTLLVVSVNATQILTIQVPPYAGTPEVINLNSGDKFSGSFSISGGNGGIAYIVRNPIGQEVASTNGLVYSGGTIDFTANVSGAYTFTFYNNQIESSKTVILSYNVIGPDFFSYLMSSGLLWIILGLVMLSVAIIGLRVVWSRRKSTARTSQSPPTNNAQQSS